MFPLNSAQQYLRQTHCNREEKPSFCHGVLLWSCTCFKTWAILPHQHSPATPAALQVYGWVRLHVQADSAVPLRLKIHKLPWCWSRQCAATPEEKEERKRQGGEALPYPGSVGKPSMECVGLPGFNPAEVGRMYVCTVQPFTADSFSRALSHLAGLSPLKQEN